MQRDGYFTEPPVIHSYQDLVEFIQRMNSDWIAATRRLSPGILLGMLRQSETELVTLLETLNPDESAMFSVAWAGEEVSTNGFDIAREYTEKWHHQMQIRLSVGQTGCLYLPRYFQPIIDCFIKAIPVAYQKLEQAECNLIIEITGECGGLWYLQKHEGEAAFVEAFETENKVIISQEEFWQLVTNSKPKQDVIYTSVGDTVLAELFLKTVAVMS
ncbi:hypothetical protein PAHA111176_22540 [Parendozoicomonas haliclonae]|uniref:Uncharacterized protein n=2 Tax=Parendozoicomonas haliclonae TaxID=1960125 RepID=A0A1X7ARM4_9GAMM|nr:hypothetical protein EHSB41UT_04620 [Parendozoicomonas haliclonae]